MSITPDSYSEAIEAACRAHGRYDQALLGDLDFYLQVAESFSDLHAQLLRRANAEALKDPESPAARFWLTLVAGIVAVHEWGQVS